MRYNFIIKYKGIEFEFSGIWVDYIPKKITDDPLTSYPEEGGYFEDYSISLYNIDLTDFLDNKVIEDIYELAKENI